MPSQRILSKSIVAAMFISGAIASSSMDCGDDVELCGVLTLESGFGSGNYEHSEPVVHGLWPEVGSYGDSYCLTPDDTSSPTVIYSCYDDSEESDSSNLSFEQHEWTSHGICSGCTNAEDFFTQVCDLSIAPLAIMTSTRDSGGDLNDMAEALTEAGYEIFDLDSSSNSQLELSVCAGPDRKWVLSPVANFSSVCGGWSDSLIVNNTKY